MTEKAQTKREKFLQYFFLQKLQKIRPNFKNNFLLQIIRK